MRRLRLSAFIGAAALLEALTIPAFAQNARLVGRVTDAANGDELPGATVSLVGTALGAVTDVDGNYVIIGIAPGMYEVRVSYTGYTPQVTSLRLVSDRPTTYNVALRATDVEVEELVVESTRPVVDPNQTTSRAIVTGEEIAALPVASINEALSRTANSYDGFVRGSRRYETRTLVDGVDVSDALSQIAPNGTGTAYSGQVYNNTNRAGATGNSLFTLSPEGVEEVTVNTGAVEARLGAASGGVVSMSLASGRGPLRGTASFRVAPSIGRPGPDSMAFYNDAMEATYTTVATNQRNANAPTAGRFTWTPETYQIGGKPEVDARLSLGGSITDNWSFFTTGQWFQSNGYQPNQFDKRIGGQFKTTYTLGEKTTINALGIIEDRGLWGNWNNTAYNDYWRFYLQGVAQNDGGSSLGSIKVSHLFSQTLLGEVQFYSTYKRTRYGYVDDNGNGFTDLGENGDFIDFSDPVNIAKYIGVGSDYTKMFNENVSGNPTVTGITIPSGLQIPAAFPVPYSEDATQRTTGFKADLSTQIGTHHYLQAGIDARLRTFDYEQVAGIDQTGAKLSSTVEPFVYQGWTRKPSEIGFYVSDRMEYAGLRVNLGLRLERVNRDMEKINDYFHPFRRDTVNIAAAGAAEVLAARNVFDRGAAVPADWFWNPSVGVSHPIGSKASMYFSFARTSQLLPYTTLYQFYDGNNSNNVFYTYQDPEQKPLTSNNYELGAQWEFAPGWGADVNAYMRFIQNYGQAGLTANNRNLTGQTTLVGGTHTFATSAGYADVRGIELVLRRAPLKLMQDVRLALTASYTFSSIETSNFAGSNVTTFVSSGADVTTLPFDATRDFRNYPQSVRGGNSSLTGGFDRTHRFILRSTANLPYGINWGLTSTLESGFLYPPVVNVDPRNRELLTGPTNFRIDTRIEKAFNFTQRFGLDLYLDVTNLTNAYNIVAYDTSTPTSSAAFQVDGSPGTRLILQDGTAVFSVPRTAYFGTRLRF